jgi:hypothetical protein
MIDDNKVCICPLGALMIRGCQCNGMNDGDEPVYAEAGATVNPRDYYFYAIHKTNSLIGGTWVFICPKSFFDKEGYQFDQHLSIDAGGPLNLPDPFDEVAETQFIFNGSVAQAESILKNMGMTRNKMNL